jgi:hypothetical protein
VDRGARDRLARRGSTVCFLLAAAVGIGAACGDALLGRRATILLRLHDEEERAEQRRLRDARDDVAEIYGTPVPGTERVILFDPSRWIEPPEAPDRSLVLLGDARERGTSPARWWLGAAVLGSALALTGATLRRSVGARRPLPATLPVRREGE